MTTTLAIIVACLVTTMLVFSVRTTWRKSERWKTVETLKALRWWMVPGTLLHLILVGSTAYLLWNLPVFSIGWYGLISGQPGNALVGQNSNSDNTILGITGVLIPVLLALAVPNEARAEEHVFRGGAQQRTTVQRARSAIIFGLFHLIVGVPLAVGTALIVSGIYYDQVYIRHYRRAHARYASTIDFVRDRDGEDSGAEFAALVNSEAQRQGINSATAAHAASNWAILSVLFLALAASI